MMNATDALIRISNKNNDISSKDLDKYAAAEKGPINDCSNKTTTKNTKKNMAAMMIATIKTLLMVAEKSPNDDCSRIGKS